MKPSEQVWGFDSSDAELRAGDGSLHLPGLLRDAFNRHEAGQRVLAVLDDLLDNTYDGGGCRSPNCAADNPTIGWHAVEHDNGRASQGFTIFAVVDNGERAWTICETCWCVLLPPEEGS